MFHIYFHIHYMIINKLDLIYKYIPNQIIVVRTYKTMRLLFFYTAEEQ